MKKLNHFELNCEDFKTPMQMYPDMRLNDIQLAKYRSVNGITRNPDICALPPVLSGQALMRDNMSAMPYDEKTAHKLPKSERLAALASFKDDFVVYLPYQANLERRFYECLISSYNSRNYSLPGQSPEILSIASPIQKSVQDMSLIGTAGTGKSTSVRLMLDRCPKAIRHTIEGAMYTQIPVLEATARGDQKSLFIDLARYIDQVIGISMYENKMRSMTTVSKMESYLTSLVQIFHVGLIAIDEIQAVMKNKKSMFEHILGLTASTGISVLIIGTESAVEGMNENEWFSRRFSQYGHISSDFHTDDDKVIEYIIQSMWRYQWTNRHYELSKSIIETLKNESGKCIDFLTTLFITAQKMCIDSEGKPDELKLDASAIKKAAERYPYAKELIFNGSVEMEKMYHREKNNTVDGIRHESMEERKKEQEKLISVAPDALIKKEEMYQAILSACDMAGFKDTKLIKEIIRVKSSSEEFLELDSKQQSKIIITALIEKQMKAEKKAEKSGKSTTKEKEAVQQQERINRQIGEDDHGVNMLQAAIC